MEEIKSSFLHSLKKVFNFTPSSDYSLTWHQSQVEKNRLHHEIETDETGNVKQHFKMKKKTIGWKMELGNHLGNFIYYSL